MGNDLNILNSQSEEYLFAITEVENFRKNTPSRLRHYFQFIKDNHLKLNGNLAEFGVYRGNSLIATALILKELGSDKKVFGFDSFSGFPNYAAEDDLASFENQNIFSDATRSKVHSYKSVMNELWNSDVDKDTVSSSGDFSNTSRDLVQKKIDYFQLDNVEIIQGDFSDTLCQNVFQDFEIMSANIDCDLYDGYRVALNFVWDKLVCDGMIHLDEYYSLKFPGAKIAVDKFCSQNEINVQWQKIRDGEFPRAFLKK